MQIREHSQGPLIAREVQLMCPHCDRAVFVRLPWKVTTEQRQRLISSAIGEHRSLCSEPAEITRVYAISYPRG